MSLRSTLTRPDTLRALWIDPARMIIRRLMQPFEERARRSDSTRWIDRRYTSAIVMRYRLSELLSQARYLYGCHEFVATSVFKFWLRAGAVVADIGANLGEYTVVAGHSVGPSGHVFAAEPNPDARARIELNLRMNGLGNVTIVPAALSDALGVAELHVPDDNLGMATLDPNGAGRVFSVSTTTLDDVMRQGAIDRLDVIKADVEGHELRVFQGASRTLDAYHPAILYEAGSETLEWDGLRWRSAATDFLIARGYDIFGIVRNRQGLWHLEPVDWQKNPVGRYRMPWETLNLVALHAESPLYNMRQGPPAWAPCGVFERLGAAAAS